MRDAQPPGYRSAPSFNCLLLFHNSYLSVAGNALRKIDNVAAMTAFTHPGAPNVGGTIPYTLPNTFDASTMQIDTGSIGWGTGLLYLSQAPSALA